MHDAPQDALRFGVLGPVEAVYDGAVLPLGGAKQRGLLAALLLRGNDVVPAARLVDDLWGSESPPTAHKMVQVFLSRLRAAMVDAGVPPGVIETHPQGYALRVDDAQVDLRRAESLASAGRAALADTPDQASALLADALALWRGGPLTGVESMPFAQAAVPRLEEFRLGVLGDRVEADLASGRHARLVGELRQLTADHPLREQPHAQLMLALYRSGRQVEALETFSAFRSRLRDEVALEPSQDLRRLEHSVLTHDAKLALPERAAAVTVTSSATAPPIPPVQSPPPAQSRPPAGRRRTRRIAAAAGVIVVVAGLVIGVTLGGGSKNPPPDGAVAIVPNSVAVISPDTNAVVADVAVGNDPGAIAVLAGDAWVANRGDKTITRVALPAYRAAETYGLADLPESVTAAEDRVWIGLGFAGTLSRILPQYDQISAPFAPAVGESGLLAVAADDNDLWVGLADSSLLELDPASLRLRERVRLSGHVGEVAAAGTEVWTTVLLDHDLYQVSPSQRRVVRTVVLTGTTVNAALGDGSVWVTTTLPNRLWRVDEQTGRVTSMMPLAGPPTSLVVGGTDVWVAESGSGRIAHVDALRRQLPSTVDLGRPIGGLAISAGRLLVTVDQG